MSSASVPGGNSSKRKGGNRNRRRWFLRRKGSGSAAGPDELLNALAQGLAGIGQPGRLGYDRRIRPAH